MKTIGIILREWQALNKGMLLYGVRRDLIYFLRKYNINVITIPVIFEDLDEFEKIKESLDLCDGIIFPGGEDAFELDNVIMKYLYDIDKPTLGLCLGMQIMGKTFNNNQIGHLNNSCHNSSDEYVHKVKIDTTSLLYDIIGKEEINVNSRHNDYVQHTKLDCVAYSIPDNIIEAVEDKSKKFFIGIQWHPETLINDKNSKKIFDYFISKL